MQLDCLVVQQPILFLILFAAVGILYYIEFSEEDEPTAAKATEAKARDTLQKNEHPTTGKIAFVNIDRLNDESLEIKDLVSESKRRKMNIESNVESLSAEYQKKMAEYQNSVKAGIAPQSVLQGKEKEILALEKEAQNKQLQMENLTMDINEKNAAFQRSVKEFIRTWNNGQYDYILSYSESVPTMLFGNNSLEITDVVIKGLNDSYSQLKKEKKK